MSVLVLDDHRMVGQSIAGVLSELAGLVVLGVCASVAEASALIHQSQPELLVLDLELGGDSYCEVGDLYQQLSPRCELLFIIAHPRQFTPPEDLAERTIAVVDKAETWHQLLVVVQHWWHHSHHQSDLPGCWQKLRTIQRLAPREQRLLQELGCGFLNKEIAARLKLSVATVETYRKSVATKLGVSGHDLPRLAVLARAYSWMEFR